jgi:hypothetical protein
LVLRALAVWTPSTHQPLRLLDATPLPCGTSRETVKRSALAGLASYGYCAAHSRWYWGLKLYLLTAPDGMPVNWCLATPKLGERDVAAELLADTPPWLLAGTTVIGDKGFAGAAFDRHSTDLGAASSALTGATSQLGLATWAASASASRASSTPSKASSDWNSTAAAPRRRVGPGRPATAGPGRGAVVQPATRPARSPSHRLRPLTIPTLQNHSSRPIRPEA